MPMPIIAPIVSTAAHSNHIKQENSNVSTSIYFIELEDCLINIHEIQFCNICPTWRGKYYIRIKVGDRYYSLSEFNTKEEAIQDLLDRCKVPQCQKETEKDCK